MEENMNGSTGTIRIFLNDDTVYEAPCSEHEYVTAMKNLGAVEREVYVNNILRGVYLTTGFRAPAGMIALEFNNTNNILSVYHGDIKRIYWEANI